MVDEKNERSEDIDLSMLEVPIENITHSLPILYSPLFLNYSPYALIVCNRVLKGAKFELPQ